MAIALRRIALLAVVLALAACGGAARNNGDMSAPSDRPTVTVTNQSWLQVVMYVDRGGQRIRLGDVQSQATETFRMPAGIAYGTVRFIADPIGSAQTAQSFDMNLIPGENRGLTIPPTAFR